MRACSISSTVLLVLAAESLTLYASAQQQQGSDDSLRSPQCVQDLIKSQVQALQHFNGIFGSFSIVRNKDSLHQASIYGPIAAMNITSVNYGYNTNSEDMQCDSPNHLLRLGYIAEKSDVQGDVYGGIISKKGSVETDIQDKRCAGKSTFRAINRVEDLLESLWSFAPTAIKKTSSNLAALTPDTLINADNNFISTSSKPSFRGYKVLKLPACSDISCASVDKSKETTADFLRGGLSWSGPFQNVSQKDMILINIPVYVGGTFTISTLDVNKNISPCQAIFNFYPVDRSGKYVADPNASFTLVRSQGATIAGTILAPQANIIDATFGYFGGQLITLKNYEGHGADIRDFKSVTFGACSSRSLCWPIEHASHVVIETVTVSETKTISSTVIEKFITNNQFHNRIALASPTHLDVEVDEAVIGSERPLSAEVDEILDVEYNIDADFDTLSVPAVSESVTSLTMPQFAQSTVAEEIDVSVIALDAEPSSFSHHYHYNHKHHKNRYGHWHGDRHWYSNGNAEAQIISFLSQ